MTYARRLPDILAQSPAGAALMERYQASQRAAAVIEPECRRIVPDLAPTQSGVCELRGSTLRVNARTSAQVAKLRQAAPRLLSSLQQQGMDVSEIKFGVQPRPLCSSDWPGMLRPDSESPQKHTVSHGSNPDITQMKEFANKLVLTLPNSPLRDAASRLLSSLTRGLARMRESDQSRQQQPGKEDET
jgi:hypothetical protein